MDKEVVNPFEVITNALKLLNPPIPKEVYKDAKTVEEAISNIAYYSAKHTNEVIFNELTSR